MGSARYHRLAPLPVSRPLSPFVSFVLSLLVCLTVVSLMLFFVLICEEEIKDEDDYFEFPNSRCPNATNACECEEETKTLPRTCCLKRITAEEMKDENYINYFRTLAFRTPEWGNLARHMDERLNGTIIQQDEEADEKTDRAWIKFFRTLSGNNRIVRWMKTHHLERWPRDDEDYYYYFEALAYHTPGKGNLARYMDERLNGTIFDDGRRQGEFDDDSIPNFHCPTATNKCECEKEKWDILLWRRTSPYRLITDEEMTDRAWMGFFLTLNGDERIVRWMKRWHRG